MVVYLCSSWLPSPASATRLAAAAVTAGPVPLNMTMYCPVTRTLGSARTTGAAPILSSSALSL